MKEFQPNYKYLLQAAKNIEPGRIPLYEHIISEKIMEKVLNKKFASLYNGNLNDKREFFKNYNEFYKIMGYDTVSFERCIGSVMPGSGALGGHKEGVIRNRKDFADYPWETIPNNFFEEYADDFRLLGEELPEGMKAVGGPGNGIFESVQDVVGYVQLCYISKDDPELYDALFKKVGDIIVEIWSRFLKMFANQYTVCRFGDDLGYKTSTLLSVTDIKKKIIPQYKRIIKIIHSFNKPFLFHCCGNIFSVMEELINEAHIDAKHSNEDQIAPFLDWVKLYGDRIGNFGGVDMGLLCEYDEKQIKEYVKEIAKCAKGNKGIALGSGNSIPDYIPVANYLVMVNTIRHERGDF